MQSRLDEPKDTGNIGNNTQNDDKQSKKQHRK
jgi:hypothetical protein